MKKILLIMTCTSALSLMSTQALSNNEGPGCGVGQMLWEGNNSLFGHTTAGSTNGSFLQSFAITSGTSGCDASQQVQISDDKEIFVATNMDSLSQEIAQGQGNHLSTLASIMGVKTSDQDLFAASLQNEFSTVFSSSSASPMDVIAAIDEVMVKDTTLAKYVQ